jgi:hypothetical protein
MAAKVDSFVRQYLETALWSSTDESRDEGGDPLDDNYTIADIAPESVERAVKDCEAFRRDNAADLAGIDDESAGHDFWLTRNRHGAGFWDRGYPDGLGKRLTDSAHAFGEVHPMLGDDGRIHFE